MALQSASTVILLITAGFAAGFAAGYFFAWLIQAISQM